MEKSLGHARTSASVIRENQSIVLFSILNFDRRNRSHIYHKISKRKNSCYSWPRSGHRTIWDVYYYGGFDLGGIE